MAYYNNLTKYAIDFLLCKWYIYFMQLFIYKKVVLFYLLYYFHKLFKLELISKNNISGDINFKVYRNREYFFIKIGNFIQINNYIKGTNTIDKYLNTPKILKYFNIPFFNKKIILQQYIDGNLLSYNMYTFSDDKNIEIEKNKEQELIKLYNRNKILNFNDFKRERNCELFSNRLVGTRCNNFYFNKINKNYNKNIYINNIKVLNILNIINTLLNKYNYLSKENKKILTYLGHGDLHHGNIILSKNNKIFFIDNEYVSYVSLNSDIAKPYYNDLIGYLFFNKTKELESYFDISYKINNNDIFININSIKFPKNRISITKEKINTRKQHLNFNQNKDSDFSINEYLLMCHLFTRNPNCYSEKTFIIFLIIANRLNTFNWNNPEDLFCI